MTLGFFVIVLQIILGIHRSESIPTDFFPILGIFLFALGLMIRGTALGYLGPNFHFGKLERPAYFVTHGPYRLIRHPQFAGEILAQLGVALWFSGTWVVAIVGLVGAISLYPLRIFLEEKKMSAWLPVEWESYSSRVPYRILPGVL